MQHNSLISIKTFSEFTGVSQSTLRYYDKIRLLSPVERGDNNYRYYTPLQSVMLNYINVLRDLGVPLSTIKKISDRRTPEKIMEQLSSQESQMDQRLRALQVTYSIIHTFRGNIQAALLAADGPEISVQRLGETNIILGPDTDFTGEETYYRPFMDFCTAAAAFGINVRYPIGGYYRSMDTYLKFPSQPSKFFSLDPSGRESRPAGKYLVGYTRGYYGEMGDLPQRMLDYAKERDLTFNGPLYVLYLLDEVSVPECDQYLAQVTVGVREPKKGGTEGKNNG